MTVSRPLAVLLLAAVLTGCGAAEDAARSASEAAGSLPSTEEVQKLAGEVQGINPDLAADPAKLAEGAAKVCAAAAAGTDTSTIVADAQKWFGVSTGPLTPEQAQQVVDKVQSTICR